MADEVRSDYVVKITADVSDVTKQTDAMAATVAKDLASVDRAADNTSKKLNGMARKFVSPIDESFGAQVKTALDQFTGIGDAIRDIGRAGKSIAGIGGRMFSGLADKVKEIGNIGTEAAKGEKGLADLEKRANQTARAIGDIQTGTPLQNQTAGIEQMGQRLQETEERAGLLQSIFQSIASTNEWEAYCDSIEAATAETASMSDFWARMATHEGAFSAEAENIRGKIADIETEMQALAAQQFPTEDYAFLQNELAKVDARLESLTDKQERMEAVGVSRSSSAWRGLLYDIENANRAAETYRNEMAQMEADGSAFVPGSSTEQYAALSADLEQYRASLAEVSAEGLTGFGRLGSQIATVTKSIGSGLVSAAKAGFNAIKSGIKGVIGHFKNLRYESVSVDGVIQKVSRTFLSFARMMKTRIKRKLISAVFTDVSKDIGIIAQTSDRFNNAISSMIDSCKALGMQITAMAEPIVSIVGPIVSDVIDKFEAVADKAAQFVARLTGNDTYLKAEKGQSNYAASVDKTTASTKAATKATKEYQNTVLSFDQLHKLNGVDNADADALDETAITGIDDAKLQKAETQATKANEIADKIHDALTRHDYYGAGHAAAEGVNELFGALQRVAGWDANGEKVTKTLQSIISAVRGFVDGLDAKQIGTAIGDVINTAIESFRILTDPEEGLPFADMGKKLGDILIAGVKKVKWRDLGVDIVQGLQSAVKFVNGFLSSEFVDSVTGETESIGTVIGKALHDMFAGAVDSFEPEEWGMLIANLWNNFTDMIAEFFAEPEKFKELGTKFGTAVNTTFENVDVERTSKAVENMAESLTNFIIAAVEAIDWGKVFKTMWELFTGVLEGVTNGIVKATMGSEKNIKQGLARELTKKYNPNENNPAVDEAIRKQTDEETYQYWKTGDLGGAFAKGSELIQMLNPKYAEEIGAMLDAIATDIETSGQEVAAGVRDVHATLNKQTGDGKTMHDGLISSILNGYSWLNSATYDLTNKITDSFKGETEAIGGVSDTVEAGTEQIKTSSGGVMTWIQKFMQEYANYNAGISNGFSGMVKQTQGALRDLLGRLGPVGQIVGSVFGNSFPTLRTSTITAHARGGVVGDGQLFIANERGAEMITRGDNGTTTIANNNQLLQAVVSGVRQAMTEALLTVGNNTTGSGDGGDVVLMVDSEELARASMRGQKRMNKRSNPRMSVSFA